MLRSVVMWLGLLIFLPFGADAQDGGKIGEVDFVYGTARIPITNTAGIDKIAEKLKQERGARAIVAAAECDVPGDQQLLANARLASIKSALRKHKVLAGQLETLAADGSAGCGLVSGDTVSLLWEARTPQERQRVRERCKLDSDGDSIPDCIDRCSDSRAGTVIADDGCPMRLHDEYYGGQWLRFESGSAELTPGVRKLLSGVEEQLLRVVKMGHRVKFIGHSDGCGTEEERMILSKQRAQNVVDYLIRQGMNPGAVSEVTGRGSQQPMIDEGCPSHENNRVEMPVDDGKLPVADKFIYIDVAQDKLGAAQEERLKELTVKSRQWGRGTVRMTSLAKVCNDPRVSAEVVEKQRRMVMEYFLASGLRLNQVDFKTEPEARVRAMAKCGFRGEHQIVVEEVP